MTRRDDPVRTALLSGVGPSIDASLVHAANLCDNGSAAALFDEGGNGVGHCDKLRYEQPVVNPSAGEIAKDFQGDMRNLSRMEPEPFTEQWFDEAFERTGLKAADVVRHLQENNFNFDSPKMSKSIKGKRTFTFREKMMIAKFLRSDMNAVLRYMGGEYRYDYDRDEIVSTEMLEHIEQDAEKKLTKARSIRLSEHGTSPMPNAGLPDRISPHVGMMPILGASIGGNSHTRTLFNGQRLGDVTRPASLANNPRAYATYVHGDSMEPRYEAGEIVLVNPDKGFRKGNYVVAQVYDNEGDPPFGYVKRFLSFGDELVLEQLNPPEGEDRVMRFPRDRVVAVHRIVGTLDE